MNRKYLASTAVFLVASGCGGGGGDRAVISPDTSLQISAANAMEVAKIAYESALGSQQLGIDAFGGVIISGIPGGFSKPGNSGYQVPLPAETTACAVSGSSTVTGDLADVITPTITPGDFIQIQIDACDDGFDVVTDGIVLTDFTAFSGDPFTGLFQMTAAMTLTDFQLSLFDGQSTVPVDVINTNAAYAFTLDASNTPFVSTSIDGDSVVVDSNSSSESLTNFSSDSTVDGNLFPAPYTNSASGTLDSTQLSGVISYSNPVQFEGLGVDYPSSGEFLVQGSNSSLRLIAEDNINVRIEIDLGADGSADEIISTTWAELTASQPG